MPEEKYGDIDVNPIEAHLDNEDGSVDQQPITPDSGEQSSISGSNDLEMERLDAEEPKADSPEEPSLPAAPKTTETSEMDDQATIPQAETEPSERQETDQDKQENLDSEPSLPEVKVKKKKTPVIIVGVLAALGLSGAAFAYYYTTPKKAAADAITGIIKDSNKKLHASGSFELKPKPFSTLSDLLTSLRINLNSDIRHFNNNLKLDFNFALKNGADIGFSLGAFFEENGNIYFNLDKVADAYQKIIKQMSLDFEDTSDLISALSLIQKTLGAVDGKWWRFNISEAVDMLDKTELKLEKQTKDDTISLYGCVAQTLQQELNKTDQFANNYLGSSFLNVEPVNGDILSSNSLRNQVKNYGNLYKISIDSEKLVNFVKVQNQTVSKDKFNNCFKNTKTFEKTAENLNTQSQGLTLSEANQIADEFKNVYLGIDGLTHKLKGVFFTYSDSSNEYSGVINFSYEKNTKTIAPSNSHPISELVDHLPDSSKDGLNNFVQDLIRHRYSIFSDLEELDDEEDEDDSEWL